MKTNKNLTIEVNITDDKRIECLMEKYGTEGFGIYILILKELCKHENHQCSSITLQKLARTHRIDEQILESITHDFDLFEHTLEKELPQLSSPYIDRITKKAGRKDKAYADQPSSIEIAIKRDQNGRFANTKSKKKTRTTTDGTATGDNTKTIMKTTTVTNGNVTVRTGSRGDFCPKRTPTDGTDGNTSSSRRRNTITTTATTNWKTYLDKAVQDETWMEILAMNSGMGKTFTDHRETIIEAFRQHICLQGTESCIQSLKDVKSYLANFLRPGTLTHLRILDKLIPKENNTQQASLYPYETVDPETGERSYCGRPIPPGAPPRPDRNSFWHEETQTWQRA